MTSFWVIDGVNFIRSFSVVVVEITWNVVFLTFYSSFSLQLVQICRIQSDCCHMIRSDRWVVLSRNALKYCLVSESGNFSALSASPVTAWSKNVKVKFFSPISKRATVEENQVDGNTHCYVNLHPSLSWKEWDLVLSFQHLDRCEIFIYIKLLINNRFMFYLLYIYHFGPFLILIELDLWP